VHPEIVEGETGFQRKDVQFNRRGDASLPQSLKAPGAVRVVVSGWEHVGAFAGRG
jgi:hypothetical protein